VAAAFDTLGEHSTKTTVYHLAAQPSAAAAAREPELTERSNLSGARVLLQAAHARGATVVFGGSFRVYGDDLVGLSVDEALPYGRVGDLSHLSKVYAEQWHDRRAMCRSDPGHAGQSPIEDRASVHDRAEPVLQARVRGRGVAGLEDRPMAFVHVRDAHGAEAAELAARSDDPWSR
jgi:hypothetical protein